MNDPAAQHALAQSLRRTGDLDGALAAAEKLVQLAPRVHAAWATLGVAQLELGDLDAAIASLRRALALAPNDHAVRLNLGEALLFRGDWPEGFAFYESCLIVERAGPRLRTHRPLWDGAALNGQTILLWADGGFGDAIMLVRYIPLVRERGGNVVLLCQPELVSLLKTTGGLDRIVTPAQPIPPFDLHAPLIALPRLLGTRTTTVPARVPYLTPDSALVEHFRARLGNLPGRKIGLVWTGRATYANNANRSMTAGRLAPLAQAGDVTFISLQPGATDRPPLPLVDWTAELTDFAESAALIQNLDLVLTVDTAVAHLAGALAKPVWTMLAFAPDWRWMLRRLDSPWYPTMRLFRQPRHGDWDAVLADVLDALNE